MNKPFSISLKKQKSQTIFSQSSNTEEKKIGFDTGFFIKNLQIDKKAIAAWEKIKQHKSRGFVSCLSIFEHDRLMRRGAINKKTYKIMLDYIKYSCLVLWIAFL